MITYGNETKVKDLAEEILQQEIETLLRNTLMDFGSDMPQDLFSHTVKRLTYLIKQKYKGFLLGEVKYIFEGMTEFIKGKISVNSILQIFYKYQEEKIERQRHATDELDLQNVINAHNCENSPLGTAIAYKIELNAKSKMTDEQWMKMSIKDIAEKIKSGEIKYKLEKPKPRKNYF